MERIASFCVDHTKLQPGMYLSRQDGANGEILTWDIRMKQPNKGSYLSPAAVHTRTKNSRNGTWAIPTTRISHFWRLLLQIQQVFTGRVRAALFVGKMDNTEIPKRIAKAAGYK